MANAFGGPNLDASLVNKADEKTQQTLLYTFFVRKCYHAAAGMLLRGARPDLLPPSEGPQDSLFIMALRIGAIDLARPLIDAGRRLKVDYITQPSTIDGKHPAIIMAQRRNHLEVRYWMGTFLEYGADFTRVRTTRPIEQAPKDEIDEYCGETSLLLELIRRGHVDAALMLMDDFDKRRHRYDINEVDLSSRSLVWCVVLGKP